MGRAGILREASSDALLAMAMAMRLRRWTEGDDGGDEKASGSESHDWALDFPIRIRGEDAIGRRRLFKYHEPRPSQRSLMFIHVVRAALVCPDCASALRAPTTLQCGHTVCGPHWEEHRCQHPPPGPLTLPNGVEFYPSTLQQPLSTTSPVGPRQDLVIARIQALCTTSQPLRPDSDVSINVLSALQCGICHCTLYRPLTTPCQHVRSTHHIPA